jgi:hypothetical protein
MASFHLRESERGEKSSRENCTRKKCASTKQQQSKQFFSLIFISHIQNFFIFFFGVNSSVERATVCERAREKEKKINAKFIQIRMYISHLLNLSLEKSLNPI